MNDAFITLTNALKIPLLNEDEVAAVQHLQTEWNHWRERERQIMPLRIAEEQEEAFTAFVEKRRNARSTSTTLRRLTRLRVREARRTNPSI